MTGPLTRLLPRRTVRLRLTLLYGALFLLCGAGALAVTYVLVRHSVTPDGDVTLFRAPGEPGPSGGPAPPPDLGTERVVARAEAALAEQRRDVLRQLVVQSGTALAMLVVLVLALSWWAAGRVLRRLSTITAAAREISETNLHRRLALAGPDDELKELGDTFDELLGRLEASFEARRRFVANASHELRTPLARQRAIGQVALDDPEATVASLREAHERVLVAGEQQERLIEAMLTLVRGHAGIDVRHPFDLGEVVAGVVEARRPPGAVVRDAVVRDAVVGDAVVGDAAVREFVVRDVVVRAGIGPCPVSGHRALAERLVVNLVDNALGHNAPGGWVEVRCGPGALTVANTGPVVPPEEVGRIFQPFQRLGRARTGPGLGLGLSIVKAIATAHGARLTAEPRPGGGLVVEVAFGRGG